MSIPERPIMTGVCLEDPREEVCYFRLVELLHPWGLACPHCGAEPGDGPSGRGQGGVPHYRCLRCRRSFNAWTGTLLQGAGCPPSELLAEVLSALDRIARGGLGRSNHEPDGCRFACIPGPSLPYQPYSAPAGMTRVTLS